MSSVNIVVWGESGEGKSTLINNLVGSEVAATGKNPLGVTKELISYEASLDGVPVLLWDLPGAGDKDVPPYTSLQWLGATFKDGKKIDGLMILSKNPDRIHIGAALVMQLMDLSFSQSDKWDSVALVGTFKDKWDEGDEANFRGPVLEAFNDEVGGSISKVATISKTDFAEVKGLIGRFKGMGDFVLPSAQAIAATVCNATGVRPENVSAEMAKITKNLEEHNKELEKALIEARQVGGGRDNFRGISMGPLGRIRLSGSGSEGKSSGSGSSNGHAHVGAHLGMAYAGPCTAKAPRAGAQIGVGGISAEASLGEAALGPFAVRAGGKIGVDEDGVHLGPVSCCLQ